MRVDEKAAALRKVSPNLTKLLRAATVEAELPCDGIAFVVVVFSARRGDFLGDFRGELPDILLGSAGEIDGGAPMGVGVLFCRPQALWSYPRDSPGIVKGGDK